MKLQKNNLVQNGPTSIIKQVHKQSVFKTVSLPLPDSQQ